MNPRQTRTPPGGLFCVAGPGIPPFGRVGVPLLPSTPCHHGALPHVSERLRAKRRKAKARYLARHPEKRARYKFRDRLREYGLSVEDYAGLLKAQGGRCAICGAVMEGRRGVNVDHDHVMGVVRGLLCRPCNCGLGHFRDDPRLMRVAADYVSGNQGASP